jgi:hypothetical protein
MNKKSVKIPKKSPEPFLSTKKMATSKPATALTKLPIKKRVAAYGLI